jgi:hypothetical protein
MADGSTLEPAVQRIADLMAPITGTTPGAVTGGVSTYDNLLIVKAAIEKYKSVDAEAMRAALDAMHNVSFTSPAWSYSFSATTHTGWPDTQNHMCRVDKFGPDGFLILAPQG